MASSVSNTDSTWVTPRTYTTGELITKSILDIHIRDNLNALHTPAQFRCYIDEASNYSITGTSFADVDSTNLKGTIVTSGGAVFVAFIANGTVTTSRCQFDICVDGTTRQGLDDGLWVANNAYEGSFYVTAWITGLSAASHTFTIQAKAVTGGTLLIYAGAGTSQRDTHPLFFGFEV